MSGTNAHLTATTGGMIITNTGTCTITSNGSTFPGTMNFNGANGTYTLSGNLSVSGLVTCTVTVTVNHTASETMTLSGGLTLTNGLFGTAAVIFNGGTWSGAGNLNKAWSVSSGGVTLGSAVSTQSYLTGNTGTLAFATYLMTLSATSFTLYGTTSCTTPSAGTGGIKLTSTTGCTATFNGTPLGGALVLDMTASKVLTLANGGLACVVNGLVTVSTTTTLTPTTTESLSANYGITMNAALSGTATINMAGAMTSSGAADILSCPLNFNGNFSFANNFYYQTGPITWTAGTDGTTGAVNGHCLFLNAATTLSWNGVTIVNVQMGSNLTMTTGSAIAITNWLLAYGGPISQTINGGYAITVANLQYTPSGTGNLTFAAGTIVNVTNSLYIGSSANLPGALVTDFIGTVKSGTGSSPIYLYYTGTAANCTSWGIAYTDVTNTNGVAGAAGTPILNYGPASLLTRTTGITPYTTANMVNQIGVV